jgi:hypothetical protein
VVTYEEVIILKKQTKIVVLAFLVVLIAVGAIHYYESYEREIKVHPGDEVIGGYYFRFYTNPPNGSDNFSEVQTITLEKCTIVNGEETREIYEFQRNDSVVLKKGVKLTFIKTTIEEGKRFGIFKVN